MDIRIAVADDHLIFLESISMLIDSVDGFKFVAAAGNGIEALETLSVKQADILLCDLEMPLLDGIETTARVKELFPEVKVILLTMYVDADTVKYATNAGVSGILSKKISKKELIAAIEAVMADRIYFSEDVSVTARDEGEIEPLTEREMEVLRSLALGLSYKMIAANFGISYYTVNSHVKHIYKKLHVNSSIEALSKALKNKLISGRFP